MKSACCVLVVLLCVAFCSALTPSFQVTEMTGFKVSATYNQSTLYDIELENSPYESNQPIQLLDLHAPNAYSRGFAYAMLVGHQGVQNYNYLMASVFQTKAQQEVVEMFLQWQWDNYLSKEVPQQFLDELQGIADAGKAQNLLRLYKDVLYAIVLANFPGNVGENVYYLLISEAKDKGFQGFNGMNSEQILDLMKNAFRRVPLMHCSMFGVWGSRTTNTSLFTMRNLDWLPNSGIAVNKLITVFHPVGGHSYATVGFSGLIGALTGMSSKGLTVHEAANDSNQETFLGFAWTLRLRELMEKSANLKEATDFWKRTNNTLGMNHGVGSASDKNFVALETFAGYTAFFGANDPREADYFVTQPNGTKIQMGFPIPEAVWRTNHGYDATVVSHETSPPTSYSSNSEKRYLLIHDSITWYQSESILIDHPQAINITSVVADKGSDFYSCANTAGATNVLSVTYLPESLDMWVAFEVGGTGTSKPHLPACCGTYAHINLSQWLTPFA